MNHSNLIAFLVVTVCVGSAMAASGLPSIASVWEQCGGTSCSSGQCNDGPWAQTSCAPGLKCFRDSEYYWQCRVSAKLYDQCGGKSCQVANLCKDGAWAECQDNHSCVRKSEYYWQCLPAATAASVTASLASVPATSAKPAATQSNMRVSQSLSEEQLAHVPIPRHSIIISKAAQPAPSAAVSVASIPTSATQIRPVAADQIRPVSTNDMKPERIAAPTTKSPVSVAAITKAFSSSSKPVSTAALEPKNAMTSADVVPASKAKPSSVNIAAVSPAAAVKPTKVEEVKTAAAVKPTKVEEVKTAAAVKPTKVEEVKTAAAAKPTKVEEVKTAAAAKPTKVEEVKTARAAEPLQHKHDMHSTVPAHTSSHITSDADTKAKVASVTRSDRMFYRPIRRSTYKWQ